MSESSFTSKYRSYMHFLETKKNGCEKRWYGKTKEHLAMSAAGKPLPEWKEVSICCGDFRKDFCTNCVEAGISREVLKEWMGHEDLDMINEVYTGFTEQQYKVDENKLKGFDYLKNIGDHKLDEKDA